MEKWFLQMFADEGGEGGAEGGEGNPDGGEKLYTEAEMNARIDEVVGQKFAKWAKDAEKKASEAEKLARMNEQEKAEHERAEMQKQIDAYKAKEERNGLMTEARKTLKEADVPVTEPLLEVLVSNDAEATAEAVKSFASLFKEAVDEAVKDKLKGKTPKTGAPATRPTKEEIMSIKNTAERRKLIAENIDLFQ